MTKYQRAICMLLCFCMFAGIFSFYLPIIWQTDGKNEDIWTLGGWIPYIAYCKRQEASEFGIEDDYTYEAIIETNRKYLEEKVLGENGASSSSEEMTGEESGQEEELVIQETEQSKPDAENELEEAAEAAVSQPTLVEDIPREKLEDYDYLLGNFFIVDSNTSTSSEQINAAALLDKDLSLPKEQESPQILIYHSHSQEGYADSVQGDASTSVIGVGDELIGYLQERYGFGVIHVTDTFDIVDGELDRASAYDYARDKVEQVLAENPSVEVVIDLHRDGVAEEKHLVTEIDGKPTAQIMFFNGLSYSAKNGVIEYLPNPYISDNLAFSFQLHLAAAEYYPGLDRPIYLSSLRYNLHLKPRALLIEVGAQTNTVQEAKNAMEPLAWLLNKVLKGE